MESLMAHGTVIVTTSNRHPNDLYKNGIQRESFVPCINLLKTRLTVLNLDSSTDYRKIPRPPSGVYHHPLDASAQTHVERWFRFLGDFENDPPHPAVHEVWGREVRVPKASGKCAVFSFDDIIGRATGAADYLELTRQYEAFVITGVPGMNYRSRDLARRFITFIDAVYESRVSKIPVARDPVKKKRGLVIEVYYTNVEPGQASNDHSCSPNSPFPRSIRTKRRCNRYTESWETSHHRFPFVQATCQISRSR